MWAKVRLLPPWISRFAIISLLVVSKKQQIYIGKSQMSNIRLRKQSTPKRVRIRLQQSTTIALS